MAHESEKNRVVQVPIKGIDARTRKKPRSSSSNQGKWRMNPKKTT